MRCPIQIVEAGARRTLTQAEEELLFHLYEIAPVKRTLRVFLIDEKTMGVFTREFRLDERYENHMGTLATELLGFYDNKNGYYDNWAKINLPEIYLCIDRIESAVEYDQNLFPKLLAKVFLHELGHCYFDIDEKRFHYVPYPKLCDLFEEAFANLFVLELLKGKIQDDDLFEFAYEFIKKQPPGYCFGAYLFDYRYKSEVWKISKRQCEKQYSLVEVDSSLSISYDSLRCDNVTEKVIKAFLKPLLVGVKLGELVKKFNNL